jgi:hypothetical protein
MLPNNGRTMKRMPSRRPSSGQSCMQMGIDDDWTVESWMNRGQRCECPKRKWMGMGMELGRNDIVINSSLY